MDEIEDPYRHPRNPPLPLQEGDFWICGCTKCSQKRHIAITKLDTQSTDQTLTQAGGLNVDNSKEDTLEQNETVKFLDSAPGTTLQYNPIQDSTFYGDYTSQVELQNFLSRPVQIASYGWATGADINTSFLPWQLFFNTAAIKRKLDNYSLLSCNLKVKVMINATPFFYGCALVSYEPLHNFTDKSIPNIFGDFMPKSQRPHIYLYPSISQGGEMVLPFFYHRNFLDITESQNLSDMGKLSIDTIVPLRSANGGNTTTVEIKVFAWAEDVRLSAPTQKLALQSKDEYEDAANGVISKPASAIACVSGYLEKVPIIGPFATATKQISTAVGSIASLFGFTDVPNIDTVQPYKPLPFHAFSSQDISAPIDRLTFDPKQELTIDPRTVGLPPQDEMEISYLVQRESIMVTTDAWQTSDSSGHQLFSAYVTPCTWIMADQSVTLLGKFHTPMSYLTDFFDSWRGDIIYRFKVIASPYHTGRLKLSYDPRKDQPIGADASSSSEIFTKIIDISTEKDFEIRIPYMQQHPWLSMGADIEDRVQYFSKNADPIPNTLSYGNRNGVLNLRVLNALTAPESSAAVSIIVSVRAGENFEFANPTQLSKNVTLLRPQSIDQLEPQSQDSHMGSNYDQPSHTSISNDSNSSVIPERYLMNFGEKYTSFRQLIHRTCLNAHEKGSYPTTGETITLNRSYFPRFPMPYGFITEGAHLGKTTIDVVDRPINIVHDTPLVRLKALYVGYRGSINWSINVESISDTCVLAANRYPLPVNYSTTNVVSDDLDNGKSISAVTKFYFDRLFSGFEGHSLTNTRTNAGLQINCPDYNPNRFRFCNLDTSNTGQSEDSTDIDNMVVNFTTDSIITDSGYPCIFRYCSAGPDFNYFFFLNAPYVWDLDSVEVT